MVHYTIPCIAVHHRSSSHQYIYIRYRYILSHYVQQFYSSITIPKSFGLKLSVLSHVSPQLFCNTVLYCTILYCTCTTSLRFYWLTSYDDAFQLDVQNLWIPYGKNIRTSPKIWLTYRLKNVGFRASLFQNDQGPPLSTKPSCQPASTMLT